MKLVDADLARLALPATATDEERQKMGTGVVNATVSVREAFAMPATSMPATAPGTVPSTAPATAPATQPGCKHQRGRSRTVQQCQHL